MGVLVLMRGVALIDGVVNSGDGSDAGDDCCVRVVMLPSW